MLVCIYFLPYVQKHNEDSEKIKIETKYYLFKDQLTSTVDKEITKTRNPELFDFDPNTVGSVELKKLGFPDFIMERIIKYRISGGKFKSKEDLKKIYGLNLDVYNRIESHIKIVDSYTEVKIKKENTVPVKININEADSFSLLSVTGIGPVYAGRILKYRNSLGGFSHLDQLREVYGMNDSLYNKISKSFLFPQFEAIKKIDINLIDLQNLRKHPYFRDFKLSSIILRFRNNHGPFRTISDMKAIHVLNDSILQKIEPYISFSFGNAKEYIE